MAFVGNIIGGAVDIVVDVVEDMPQGKSLDIFALCCPSMAINVVSKEIISNISAKATIHLPPLPHILDS